MLQVSRVLVTSTPTSSPSVCWTWWWGAEAVSRREAPARECTRDCTPECSIRYLRCKLPTWTFLFSFKMLLLQFAPPESCSTVNHSFSPSVPLDVFCNSLQPRLQWFWDILHPRLLTSTEPGWTHTSKDPKLQIKIYSDFGSVMSLLGIGPRVGGNHR